MIPRNLDCLGCKQRNIYIVFLDQGKHFMFIFYHDIQLFPEGEVNSGGYNYQDTKHRGIYPPLFTDPEGDSCFSIILPNEMDKKVLF